VQGNIEILVNKQESTSSIYEINSEFVSHFPEAERFDCKKKIVNCDTLSNILLKSSINDVDFIKIDV